MKIWLDRSKPPFEFFGFSLLPKYIHVKIWLFAGSRPRVVHLTHSSDIGHIVCKQSLPAVLHVCRESRTSTLPLFQMFFDPQGRAARGRAPIIYVNPDVDTFYFPSIKRDRQPTCLSRLGLPESEDLGYGTRTLVRSLAVSHDIWSNLRDSLLAAPLVLVIFPKLETITLMIDPERSRANYGQDIVDPCFCSMSGGRPFWWKYLEEGLGVVSSDTPFELLELLHRIWHFNELKLRWEDTYKELRVPDIQVRLRLAPGHRFLQCTHDIRVGPVSRYGR